MSRELGEAAGNTKGMKRPAPDSDLNRKKGLNPNVDFFSPALLHDGHPIDLTPPSSPSPRRRLAGHVMETAQQQRIIRPMDYTPARWG